MYSPKHSLPNQAPSPKQFEADITSLVHISLQVVLDTAILILLLRPWVNNAGRLKVPKQIHNVILTIPFPVVAVNRHILSNEPGSEEKVSTYTAQQGQLEEIRSPVVRAAGLLVPEVVGAFDTEDLVLLFHGDARSVDVEAPVLEATLGVAMVSDNVKVQTFISGEVLTEGHFTG